MWKFATYKAGEKDHKKPCSRVNHVLYIKPDGTVISCFGDFFNKNIVGDAKKETVTEIWFGERFQRLRNNLNIRSRTVSPICSRCNVVSWDPDTRKLVEKDVKETNITNGAILGVSSSSKIFYPYLKKYSNVKFLVSKEGYKESRFSECRLIITDNYENVL